MPVFVGGILGESPPIKAMLSLIRKVAETKTNVLIIGESGTGKDFVARMIHDAGPLKAKPFVPVNCGAIPHTLIESELFGHRKGSFTGAVAEKAGLFEAAGSGTIFLDEVGELPLNMQVKLLRALQERVIRKVGGNDDVKVDARVIAATNRDLEAAVAAGTFREDLYYRLNVILIKTPSLRERKNDIKILAQSFLDKYSGKQHKKLAIVDPDTLKVLEEYPWPGNVRELENTLERAVTMENGDTITLSSLPPNILQFAGKAQAAIALKAQQAATAASSSKAELRVPAPDFSKGPVPLDEILGEIERKYLMAALEHCGGIKKKAADSLGITFRSIRYRLKKLGVEGAED